MRNDRGMVASHQKQWMVFFDFDNTVTSSDILDNIITRFADGEEWQKYENAWVEGPPSGGRELIRVFIVRDPGGRRFRVSAYDGGRVGVGVEESE